jgi:hypothetical protein
MPAFRGDIGFRYLKQFFLVKPVFSNHLSYKISLTYLERQNVMAQTRKYYLKNNSLTLRSKVKVP